MLEENNIENKIKEAIALLKANDYVVNKKYNYSIVDGIPKSEIEIEWVKATVKDVCKCVFLEPSELEIRTRKREIIEARQMAQAICAMLKDTISISLARIGSLIGDYDHSTVSYSVKTVNALMSTDKSYRNKFKPIRDTYKLWK